MMSKNEIFEKAAENYLLCFSSHCPLHDHCLRYAVGEHVSPSLKAVTAMHPRYEHAADGQCPLFRDSAPVKMKVGMKQHFYAEMPARKAAAIKKRLIALSSRATYYRYHNGLKPISPTLLASIEQICREEGWTAPLLFDSEVTDYVW